MADGTIGFANLLLVGSTLLVIGLLGFMLRRNLIVMFLSIEVMVQGVVLTVVAFGRYHGNLSGQAFAIFLIVLAAVEAALGLSLAVLMFRRANTLDADVWRTMKETPSR